MDETKKKTKWIIIYTHPTEKKLIQDAATMAGEQVSPYCLNILKDYIMKRLIRLENVVQLPQFNTFHETEQKMIQDINEIKEYIHLNHVTWELDRAEKLDSVAKIKISSNTTISDRIMNILKNTPLYLDQIVERLIEIGFTITPKEVLKILADLRQAGKVEQTIEMRWFLC